MRDWHDVLPRNIAVLQEQYERRRVAVRMREVGLTWEQIGYSLGVNSRGAYRLAARGWQDKSPVQTYFDEPVAREFARHSVRKWRQAIDVMAAS